MEESLKRVAFAIAHIDGGCQTCIRIFLQRCYQKEKYDIKSVLQEVKKHNTFLDIVNTQDIEDKDDDEE